MKKLAFLFVFATQVGLSTLAAQERGEMLERMFSRMDQNKDGFIEKSEAPSEFWERISKGDKNADGKIDKSEAAEGMRGAMADRGERGKPSGRRDEAKRPEGGAKRTGGDKETSESKKSSEASREAAERIKQLIDRFGKDGQVTLADLPAPLRERLAKLDKNNDKILDRAELKEAGGLLADDPAKMFERVRQIIANLDKDGDGKVALADLPAEFKDRLARMDSNKDGMIDRSELAELRKVMGGPGPGGAMGDRLQQMFKEFDKDGDGKVALADMPEQAREKLSRLDKNNDGQIEKSELAGMGEELKKMEGRFEKGDDLSPQKPKRPDSEQ